MNSPFLSNIGLGTADIGVLIFILFILLVLTIGALVYMIVENARMKKAYKKFMKGSTAESLEDKIFQISEEQDALRKVCNGNSRDIKNLYLKHQSAFQKVGLVKYDAFNEMGGKLSFCLVLLDENDTGILLNSIHNTSGCYFSCTFYCKLQYKSGVSNRYDAGDDSDYIWAWIPAKASYAGAGEKVSPFYG